MDSDISSNQLRTFDSLAIPVQSRRNNRGFSSHELLYETTPDETNGHAWRRILWKRSRIYVWTAKHQVRLHNVWSET
jgi:hypothetical protein